MNADAETARLLQAGRLEQRCPDCGRDEAAGYYCSGCARPTGPAEWYRPVPPPLRAASLARATAARHKAPGVLSVRQEAAEGPAAVSMGGSVLR